MTSAERAKRDIEQALKSREARVAILIDESIRNVMDLVDQQSAAVLETLVERHKPGHMSRSPPYRSKLRACVGEYLEERLHEAQERERKLAQAITGAEHLPGD